MTDKIKALINTMQEYSNKQEYEKANKVLINIYSELYKEKEFGKEWLDNFLSGINNTTIKDTFDYITGNSVRLDPEEIGFSKFLKLTIDVNEKLKKLKRTDDYIKRKVIAEEMVYSGQTIPVKWKGKKPNRAFLDIALKVNPSICKAEIERREKVKLWKALESNKIRESETIKRKIKELKELSLK